MLPLHATSASTAMAQFRLVGNLLSKLPGWVHFSLDHTLPAQYNKCLIPLPVQASALLTKLGRWWQYYLTKVGQHSKTATCGHSKPCPSSFSVSASQQARPVGPEVY